PGDFATGAHTLQITRADGTALTPLAIEVVTAGSLATTGASLPTAAILLGLGALVTGGALLLARRRRVGA
uniref:LPXTG cell wall anchor domain-containing protein n=1 Tax=Microbacterium testaceum TaxID=2033 RepID=UPI0022E2B817